MLMRLKIYFTSKGSLGINQLPLYIDSIMLKGLETGQLKIFFSISFSLLLFDTYSFLNLDGLNIPRKDPSILLVCTSSLQ